MTIIIVGKRLPRMPSLLHTKDKYHPFYVFIFASPFLSLFLIATLCTFVPVLILSTYCFMCHLYSNSFLYARFNLRNMPSPIHPSHLFLHPSLISWLYTSFLDKPTFSVLLKSHKISLRCYSEKVQISHLEYLWEQQ